MFSNLFPPAIADNAPEMCILDGEKVNMQELNFHLLPKIAIPDATWVDGGSSILFSTPTRALAILRVCAIKTEETKRTSITTHTYIVSITRSQEGFLVKNSCINNPDSEISNCLETTITDLPPETTPEQLVDILRALAEQCKQDGLTIHDGSTRTEHPYLQKHLKKTIGLAKSSYLITTKGRPLTLALLEHAPQGVWWVQLTKTTACVRLHERSDYVFLLEQPSPNVLALLSHWSADAAFPGYPYPLILADQIARVTNAERDMWKVILSNQTDAIELEKKTLDAHDVLEHIIYGKKY